MTEEEFKKLVQEYQEGLKQVEEAKREHSEKYENLSEEEFKKAFEKELEEILEDVRKHPVKTKFVKK